MNKKRSVHLREKKLKNGKLSLYLDYYPPIYIPQTGKETRREFLGIYLHEKPKTEVEKEINRVGKAKAQSIRSERELELINNSFDLTNRLSAKLNFLEYFNQLGVEKKKANSDVWVSASKYLALYTKGKCTFGDVNEKFCEGFKKFLMKAVSKKTGEGLSQNTQHSYFNKFIESIEEAYQRKLISTNPVARIDSIGAAETEREFLTFEELKALYMTECKLPVLKRAAIFSALTGLRWVDIEKLTWKEVQYSESSGYFLRFTQEKTEGVETLFIPEQAYEQLGERGKPEQKVFKGLSYSDGNNLKLARWVMNAGISKKITFHCFRHTFATLQLTLGTDIYTVSKMLGHRHVKTTEIYAKIIDLKKIEAATKIKL
jgi:integrase